MSGVAHDDIRTRNLIVLGIRNGIVNALASA